MARNRPTGFGVGTTRVNGELRPSAIPKKEQKKLDKTAERNKKASQDVTTGLTQMLTSTPADEYDPEVQRRSIIEKRFNQESVKSEDTSQMTDMSMLFYGDYNFEEDIGSWDTSNVTNMSETFNMAMTFNQPIDNWDTSNVTNMESMFSGATGFNQPLDNWDTSNVTNMEATFTAARKFNQNIGNWNVSNVTNMDQSFSSASHFNQNLGNWDISNVQSMQDIFKDSGMSPENISATLTGWAQTAKQKGVQPNVDLGRIILHIDELTPQAHQAIDHLQQQHGWKIKLYGM